MKPRYIKNGVTFTRTGMGQACFIRDNDKDAGHAIFPEDWRISQLEEIIKFMKENPECTLYPDGSGSKVKE